MRLKGTLTKWNKDRGFGFITMPSHQKEVFIHVSALPGNKQNPEIGDIFTFELHKDEKGRSRAMNAQHYNMTSSRSRASVTSRTTSPIVWGTAVVAAVALSLIILRLFETPATVRLSSPHSNNNNLVSAPELQTYSFECDGRQYCGQMTSRAEAEFFLKHCPNTKMDGDDDGIPCENDTRF